MRILILGGDGMLGHQLLRHFSQKRDTRTTLRRPLAQYTKTGLFTAANTIDRVDVCDFDTVHQAITGFRPDAVINATGIVKQRAEAEQAIPSIEINALFPHRMALLCAQTGTRFVHMSTDCVFSGQKGNYTEQDVPDASDIYGRSKLLGEVLDAPGITLRTSIIGHELSRKTGLLEWFLAQQGTIRGYRNAIFSGFTTIEMARIIDMLLTRFPQAHGLYHVSSEPISKYDLLCRIRDRMGLSTRIEPDDDFRCDRSLDSSRFRAAFNYQPPAWKVMIDELVKAKR